MNINENKEGCIKLNKFMKNIISAAVLWLVAALIIFPKECIDAGIMGVFLCLDTVIPSLFPFFVCSGLIIGFGLAKPLERLFAPVMKPLFGVSGAGALPFTLGLISGYPVGAKCVADLYSRGGSSRGECEKLLAFCNNSGPLFILGAVGAGMIENPAAGRYLYIIHILSAFITGIIFRFIKTDTAEQIALPPAEPENWCKTIINAFSGAVDSILTVCGFVVLFCVASAAIPKIGLSPVIHGIFEITGGCQEILNMGISFNLRLAMVSGIIAFSGFSVMLQVGGIIGKTDLSLRFYVLGKTIQAGVAFLLTWLFMRFFPISESTFSGLTLPGTPAIWQSSLAASAVVLILALLCRNFAVDNRRLKKYNGSV